jgi:glycosyltransferase involved in cell wall biosynthesis
MLFTNPKVNVVATILAKDEEDIIGPMIEHTIEQGVSKIIFTDNNSKDRTREIASSYPEVVEIIDEEEDNHNQSKWVTKMARLACKLRPDWIVHLDADELWFGIQNLRKFKADVVQCERVYIHPPISKEFSIERQRYYMDFDNIEIPQECKIAHRPIKDIVITHGNHGVKTERLSFATATQIYRHHYPIRTYEQWERKSEGHVALERRGSCCERWKKWHSLFQGGEARKHWEEIIRVWNKAVMERELSHQEFVWLSSLWAEEEMIELFLNRPYLVAEIGEWPKIRESS